MTDDIELLRRYAKDGSEAAFSVLVQRHLGIVYGAALRQLQGSTHRAEEVAQSVFIDLARKSALLLCRKEIVGWLYTSTHHAAAMLRRSEARRQKHEKEAHMYEVDPKAALDWEQITPVLDDAMLELSDADRMAVLLRFFQNQRLAEVGQRIGLSEDAARMRIERALDKLRARLRRRGISSTGAALAAALSSQAAIAAPASLFAKVTGAALAGGAMTGAGAPGLVQLWSIMSTTKTLAATAGIIGLLALGTATYQTAAVRNLTAEVASLEQQRDSSTAERDRLRKQNAELRLAFEDNHKSSTVVNASDGNPSSLASSAANVSPTRPGVSYNDILLNPEYVQLAAKMNVAKLAVTYADFYRKMNLSPEQIQEFERLMAAQLVRSYDVWGATQAVGIQDHDPAYASAMKNNTTDTTANLGEWIQRTLGPNGGDSLVAYNRTKPIREVARNLAGEAYDTSAPLSAAQGEQLVQLLAESSAAYQRGGVASTIDLNWDAVMAKATAFLSPEQMVTLSSVRNQRVISQDMTRLSQKLQKEPTPVAK